MRRPRTYKTEAVVIRQMPLGEADRILTFCAPSVGKVRAVAKGVRRPRSRLGGSLELLNRVSVSLAAGRNLDVVNEASVISTFGGFRGDLRRVSCALYIAELMDNFSVEESGSGCAYGLLVDALGWLGRAGDVDMLLRWFEMRLLDCSGYVPELVYCVGCRGWLEPGDHTFACGSGGVVCAGCRAEVEGALLPVSMNTMKTLRFLRREGKYDGVDGLSVSEGVLMGMERIMRTYIQHVVEREIKSADFVRLTGRG